MARGDQQVIDITDELWSGEWAPWNAPDRPTPKGPGLVLVGRTGISIPRSYYIIFPGLLTSRELEVPTYYKYRVHISTPRARLRGVCPSGSRIHTVHDMVCKLCIYTHTYTLYRY